MNIMNKCIIHTITTPSYHDALTELTDRVPLRPSATVPSREYENAIICIIIRTELCYVIFFFLSKVQRETERG